MHMYHFHRYTHTALSVSYGTVYTLPMGKLQRWCMYLFVCDAVLENNNNNNKIKFTLKVGDDILVVNQSYSAVLVTVKRVACVAWSQLGGVVLCLSQFGCTVLCQS